jgi:hypothetical protein
VSRGILDTSVLIATSVYTRNPDDLAGLEDLVTIVAV